MNTLFVNRHYAFAGAMIWLGLLFLFSLPALSPLFSPTLTRSADGLLHLYRLVQLDALWRDGIFFARWMPDLAYGYGLPLFNYYAPLVYYLTAPVHLFGIPFPLALNLSLASALFVGAVGMFYFTRALIEQTRRIFDAQENRETKCFENPSGLAALIAALAFLYAPYILFNALQRANLAEQWALAFTPFALWRFFELTRKTHALNWSLAVISFAAVMLSHNVTSFLFAPLLLWFTLACILSFGVRERLLRGVDVSRFTFLAPFSSLLSPLSAFLCALALSSFFWLPALVERDFAQIARVIVTPDFDYRFNFVPFGELISLLPRADTGRLNPSFPAALGIFQILFASVGIVFLLRHFRSRRALPLLTLACAAFGFIALMLSFSQPIWDSVSLLSFVQLPMRVRGLVALCLAPFAGIFIFALPTRWRIVGACIAILTLAASALPLLYPRYARDVPLNPTRTDMFAYEQATGAFGTTSFGEYLPVWVQNLPNTSPFQENYARGEIPNRFVIPEGVTLCGADIAPLKQTLCASANNSWQLLFRAFYFPGWRATLDGRAIEMSATPRTGLISIHVPASGLITVEYVGTTIERAAGWISLVSALVVSGIFAFGIFQSTRAANSLQRETEVRDENSHATLGSRMGLALGITALVLVACKFFYVDRVSNPFVAHYDGARVEDIAQPLQIEFGEQLQLLGYAVTASEIARGDTLRVTLYLRARPALDTNLSTFVHLTAPDGFVVAQKDNLHPAHLPTMRWDVDAYAADEHPLEIPNTLAPGVYELRAGVYDARSDTRVRLTNGADFVSLQKITVK